MTTEVEVAEVKLIIDTQFSDPIIQVAIDAAILIVDEDLAPLNELTVARLKMIAQYLAAHYLTVRQQEVAAENVGGDLTVTYQGKTDQGFASSFYGQTAVNMDKTGTLRNLEDANKRAFFDAAI